MSQKSSQLLGVTWLPVHCWATPLTSTYSWLWSPTIVVYERKESMGWEAPPIGNEGGIITILYEPQMNGVWTNCSTVLRIA